MVVVVFEGVVFSMNSNRVTGRYLIGGSISRGSGDFVCISFFGGIVGSCSLRCSCIRRCCGYSFCIRIGNFWFVVLIHDSASLLYVVSDKMYRFQGRAIKIELS